MHWRPILFVAACGLVLCEAIAGARGQSATGVGAGEAIGTIIARETLGQFWGAVVVADRGEVVFSRGYGLANDALVPLTADALFDIGSISKAFTAAAVLRLEMEGRLRIDATIDHYLPGVPDHAKHITLAHLLGHTSGVAGGDSMREDAAEEVVRAVLERPLKFEPGSRMEYSNPGYFLLAAIIEKVSGQPYERYVHDQVLAPANMTTSTVIGLAEVAAAGAGGPVVTARVDEQSRRRSWATSQPYSYAWGYKGAGGVVASAADMLRFDRALRGDDLLDAEARRRMFTAGPGGYGLGWFVSAGPCGWRHEHSGAVWGYTSDLIRHEDGTVIIVLTNGRNNAGRLASMIEAAVIPGARREFRAELFASGVSLDSRGLLKIERTAGARVVREGGSFRLDLFDGERPDRTLARVTMSPAASAELVQNLRDVLNTTGGSRRGAGAAGSELWLATSIYTPAAGGVIRLPDDVRVVVQGGFSTRDEQGVSRHDTRPSLIVMDEAGGFWPVILMMNEDLASELVAGLAAEE